MSEYDENENESPDRVEEKGGGGVEEEKQSTVEIKNS